LAESLEAGGMGFSTTISPTHNDGEGHPVPSRHATKEELVELSRVVRDFAGTTIEFLPGIGVHTDENKQLMTDVSLAANRPVNWNVLAPSSQSPELVDAQLSTSDYARERGAEVIALTVPQPMSVRINLHAGFVFDALPGWSDFFLLSVEERIAKLGDPEYRAYLDGRADSEEAGFLRGLANWAAMRVDQVVCEENEKYVGRTVGEIAEAEGKKPFDVLCDLAIADDLHTYFMPQTGGDDDASWQLRGDTWKDDRTVIGASDAGAHLDMIDTFAFSTQVLGNGVRKHGVISIEEAVRQLTDVPARLYGLKERGRIEEGWFADLVVFDADTVDSGPTYTRFDLPTGAGRLYADAEGIEHVFVNGVEIVRGQVDTGARPGTVLRSGRDTETVEVPGGGNA
jgi:N-acyl-D-aspartate/D-glutamate deacylase